METAESQALLDEIDEQIAIHTRECPVSEPDAGCNSCTNLWTNRANAHA